MRVLGGDAEAEGAHRLGLEDDSPDRLDQFGYAGITAGEEVAELLSGVAAAAPRKAAQVGAVGYAEVLEADEEALVERLPEAKLDRDPPVEPGRDVFAVEALGFNVLGVVVALAAKIGSKVIQIVEVVTRSKPAVHCFRTM